MARLSSSTVNQNANQLEHIRFDKRVRIREMFYLVRGHVNTRWKLKYIIDLASHKGGNVEIKPHQVEDKIVWDIFQAGPIRSALLEVQFN